MSFGLRTWSEDGTVQMDTDTFTYQVLHNQLYELTKGQIIDVSIPEFSTVNCVATILPTAKVVTAKGDCMPFVVVSDGLVKIRSYNQFTTETWSAIEFRLIVMRYK